MRDDVTQVVILMFEMKSLPVDKGKMINYGEVSSSAPSELRHYIVHLISDCQIFYEGNRMNRLRAEEHVWLQFQLRLVHNFQRTDKPEE